MSELELNAHSVNYLITELCRSQIKQYGLEASAAVNKFKARSFEVLLKKSEMQLCNEGTKQDEEIDPQRLLDMQIFGVKLEERTNPQKFEKYLAFEKQLEFVRTDKYFQENPGKAILQFLLALQKNASEEFLPTATELLVPGPFTLHATNRNLYYPNELKIDWLQPAPKNFKGIKEIKSDFNPYLPKFFNGGEPNKLAPIQSKFGLPSVIPNELITAQNDGNLIKHPNSEIGNKTILCPRPFQLLATEQPLREQYKFINNIPEKSPPKNYKDQQFQKHKNSSVTGKS